MKLFLDENISPLHARELRAKGYDALAVVEAGLSGASDEIILEFAVREDRILVTLDADFANAPPLSRRTHPWAGAPSPPSANRARNQGYSSQGASAAEKHLPAFGATPATTA